MSAFDFIPLAETSQTEEAQPGTVAAALPLGTLPKPYNYAKDAELVAQIQTTLVPQLQWIRNDRFTLEEEWRAILRMEALIHDEGQRYRGRSNAYLPVYIRSLQTQVSGLSRGLFPSDEYLDVTDRGSNDLEAAKAVKQLIQWEFESIANVRKHMRLFLRPYMNFGIGILKHWYQKSLVTRGSGKNAKAGKLPGFRRGPNNDGLRVSARNPFHWYMYPTTAETLDEAQIIFEDMDVPMDYALMMQAKGRWENVDRLVNTDASNFDTNQLSRLEKEGMQQPKDMPGRENRASTARITEVWTFMALPSNACYVEGETVGELIPVRVVLSGDTVLEVDRNPYFHQRPPYEVSRQNVQPGNFYGYGPGRVTRYLQYLSNDFANQTNDVGTYGLNPIVKAQPSLLVGPLKPIAPGVIWNMNDKDAVTFERPPVEIVQYGLQMMNSVIGMAQDFGGAPPVLQGSGSKGSKTATGTQILQRNAMQPLQDEVENIENDVMVPLMRACWYYNQQYREEDVMATIAGQPVKIPLEALTVIDPDFRWLASNQAANQQQRAQAGMQFIQAVAPLVPLLAQSGKQVDFEPLLKRVFTDGLGFRGFSDFIKPLPMQPGMPGGMPGDPNAQGGMPPGMPPPPPGMPPEVADRIRSAVEQANGGPDEGGDVDMVAGEGEDFATVRNNADAMASDMGGQGGEF